MILKNLETFAEHSGTEEIPSDPANFIKINKSIIAG